MECYVWNPFSLSQSLFLSLAYVRIEYSQPQIIGPHRAQSDRFRNIIFSQLFYAKRQIKIYSVSRSTYRCTIYFFTNDESVSADPVKCSDAMWRTKHVKREIIWIGPCKIDEWINLTKCCCCRDGVHTSRRSVVHVKLRYDEEREREKNTFLLFWKRLSISDSSKSTCVFINF